MSAKRGLIALGAAMVSAAAVARFMVLSQGNKRDDLKAGDISKSELMTEANKTENDTIKKAPAPQAKITTDKDELKRARDEEEFKTFALFWNSWK